MGKVINEYHSKNVQLSVWENENKEGLKYYSITIGKAIKDGEIWKRYKTFSPEDLPDIASVAMKAYSALNAAEGITDKTSTESEEVF